MSGISAIAAITGTLIICIFTWHFSIRLKRPHGIPRFFSFESILLLTIQNYEVWTVGPLAWNQLISWVFLTVSIIFAAGGFLLLKFIGKSGSDFEDTKILVTTGLYKYIRHPMYASLLLLGTGIFLKRITISTAILAMINVVSLIITARREEKEMLQKFDNAYSVYMKKTKMFIPFVY